MALNYCNTLIDDAGVGKCVVSSYPHALEAGQRSQWPQRPQRSQGLDGRKIRVAQGVSYQANQRNLMDEMTLEEQLLVELVTNSPVLVTRVISAT